VVPVHPPFVDHHCHSLTPGWMAAAAEPPAGGRADLPRRGSGPAWRRCFTEARRPESLARDVPGLLGYSRFLAALARRLAVDPLPTDGLEARVAAARDAAAAADPAAYLRGLWDDGGLAALLVDTGLDAGALPTADLARIGGRPVHEVVRVESVVEDVLGSGGRARRTLGGFVEAVEARLHHALDAGAVALKSIAAYRFGLALPEHSTAQRRRAFRALGGDQARRFDDRVLGPFLVRRVAALAAARGVPLQLHTGFGDEDLDLAAADPALLRPLFRDPRTEGCKVVLLHCHPFVRHGAYLAGTYPQVHLDLSLAIPLAEPTAELLVTEALGLCPVTKLLAASDGHSYPEMHWWGATVWRRALGRVLDAEVAAGTLDQPAATAAARDVLAGNATRLYRL